MEASPTRILPKAFFFVLALPAILRASRRLMHCRDERLDRQVAELRRARGFRWSSLRHPAYLAASVDRVLGALPPFGYGRCFKRSLLLLDLWSRCGLEPVLHLGVLNSGLHRAEGAAIDPAAGGARHFHAWVSTADGGPFTSSQGHEEIWRG